MNPTNKLRYVYRVAPLGTKDDRERVRTNINVTVTIPMLQQWWEYEPHECIKPEHIEYVQPMPSDSKAGGWIVKTNGEWRDVPIED